jgi:dihydroflavonol-4-reductase
MEKGKIGESYMITGDVWKFADVIGLGPRVTGIPAPPSAPPWVFKTLSKLVGVFENVLPIPSIYTSEGLRVIAGVTYIADDSKARRELGYSARPADQGLTETVLHEMKILGMTPPK